MKEFKPVTCPPPPKKTPHMASTAFSITPEPESPDPRILILMFFAVRENLIKVLQKHF